MGAAGFGAGAGQAFAAEGLEACQRASTREARARAANPNLSRQSDTLGHQAIHHRVHQAQLKR